MYSVSGFLLKWPFTVSCQGVQVAVQPVPPRTMSELRERKAALLAETTG